MSTDIIKYFTKKALHSAIKYDIPSLSFAAVAAITVSACSADINMAVNTPKFLEQQPAPILDVTRSALVPDKTERSSLMDFLPSASFNVNLSINDNKNKKFSYTAEDRDYFIRTTVTEVGNQIPEEIEWVANVIINRHLSGEYGNSIKDVTTYCKVYKSTRVKYVGKKKHKKRKITYYTSKKVCQFSVWNPYDNSYNLVSTDRVYSHPQWNRVSQIVDSVLEYRLKGADDPSKGCMNYYHPKAMVPVYSAPSWAYSAEATYKIGDGVFIKLKDFKLAKN